MIPGCQSNSLLTFLDSQFELPSLDASEEQCVADFKLRKEKRLKHQAHVLWTAKVSCKLNCCGDLVAVGHAPRSKNPVGRELWVFLKPSQLLMRNKEGRLAMGIARFGPKNSTKN